MRELAIFNFEQLPVRIVSIDGEPWFVAADVASILGYTNPQKAVRDHCKYAKSLKDIDGMAHLYAYPSPILDPQTKLIPESDLYRLIIRSKLPAAEKFEAWLMEEVLPTIRKTGYFSFDDIFRKLQNDGFDLPPEQSLYVIRDESGNVKIGISADPYARLKQLQCGNAEKLTLVLALDNKTIQDEKALHKALAKFNVRGEWFKDSVLTSFEV